MFVGVLAIETISRVIDALFCGTVELTALYEALAFVRGRKFAILITHFAVITKSTSWTLKKSDLSLVL